MCTDLEEQRLCTDLEKSKSISPPEHQANSKVQSQKQVDLKKTDRRQTNELFPKTFF